MAGTRGRTEESIPFEDIASAFDKFQNDSENLDDVELNIAVTGETGSGKSTFVNAFRGLRSKDEGAAPTGVTETTMKPTPYPYPKYQKVTLWDLPGIGSQTFRVEEYLQQVNFECYDFFIIIISERFKQCHIKLAKEINKVNKKYYFVRSKIDQDVKNASEDKGCDEKTTLEDIRNNCIKELQNTDLASVQVFLISSRELRMYDFSRLHQTIETDLPQLKKDLLLLDLLNKCLKINKREKEALQANIWQMSLLSAGATAVPIAGISVFADMIIIIRELREYYKALSLDEQSLEMLAKKSGKSMEELSSNVKSPLLDKVGSSELIKLLSRVAATGMETVAKEYLSLIPGLGSLVAGVLSFATIFYLLHSSLNDLAEDAQNVLMFALKQQPEMTK